MRRRFVTRRYNQMLIYKIIGSIILLYLIYLLIFKPLFKLEIDVNNEIFINEYLSVGSNNLIRKSFVNNYLNYPLNSPTALIAMTFSNMTIKPTEMLPVSKPIVNKDKEPEENKEPIIYIYNTHQSEEYNAGNLKEYNIVPTVYMASFMLQKALEKYNIYSIVEEDNMKQLLQKKGLKYDESYIASRTWLEKAKNNYPSVKYYIDLHRDSASSVVTIDEVSYAKMMFVVGKKHDNYQKNEELMTKITNEINSIYPDLVKKPYSGNRYNQDFDPNVMLVEVGGPKNSIDEVYNSINALAEGIARIIGEI